MGSRILKGLGRVYLPRSHLKHLHIYDISPALAIRTGPGPVALIMIIMTVTPAARAGPGGPLANLNLSLRLTGRLRLPAAASDQIIDSDEERDFADQGLRLHQTLRLFESDSEELEDS